MPAPIDLSVWGSLYALQKADDDGQVMTTREADVDFGVGYGITTLLAVAFAVLGWLVMYGAVDEQGNPVTLAQGGVGFSQQFVNMYTQSLGDWSFGLVAFVAIATMVSTSVTCIDGYPRAVTATLQTIRRKDAVGDDAAANSQIQPWSLVPALLIMTGAALLIVWLLIGNLLQMLQVAMIIAACTAPIFAWLNIRLISGGHMPQHYRPARWIMMWAWLGLVALLTFLIIYGVYLIGLIR